MALPGRTVNRLGRIRWQCRRGKRELDIILQPFVDAELARLDAADLILFEALLDLADDQLLLWLTGAQNPDRRFETLVARIRDAAAM